MKKYMMAIGICVVMSLFADEFVKPRKQQGVSTASLREKCGSVLADILELSHDCAQRALDGQRVSMNIMRSWLGDDDSFLTRASKTELCEKSDALVLLKKRYQKVCNELQAITTEFKMLEASCQ